MAVGGYGDCFFEEVIFSRFFSRNCFVLCTAQRKEARTQGLVCVWEAIVSVGLFSRAASCLATLFVFGVAYFREIFFLATAQRRGALIIWESKSFEEGDYALVYALNIVSAILINNNACLSLGTRYFY